MKEVSIKRGIALIMSIVCALTLCFAIVGCGGNEKAKLVGEWEVVEMVDPTLGTIDASALKAYGLEISLVLNDDGSAIFDLFGQTIDGTWEPKGNGEMTLTMDGSSTDSFSLKDNQLVGEQNGSKLIFEKVTG